MFRGIVILCLIGFVAIGLVCAENYTWGYRHPNDRLLSRLYAEKSSSFMQIVTMDVNFPNKTVSNMEMRLILRYLLIFLLSNLQANASRAIINQIVLMDQKTPGNGAFASVSRGGLGFNYTTISMKSQRNHGIRFTVDIYGF